MKIPLIGVNMDFSPDDGVRKDGARRDRYYVITQYLDSIYDEGGIPVPIPCTRSRRLMHVHIDALDGFLFIGGADYPPEYYGEKQVSDSVKLMEKRRYESDMALAEAVLGCHFPILGICGGAQLINIISGGKLVQDIESSVIHAGGAVHKVKITGGKILRSLFGGKEFKVNSFHHQAISPCHIGKGFEVAALSEDGIIEAIESKSERFMLGLQWHPERMAFAHRNKIFKTFVKACGISGGKK